ncbi:hypothetical protein DDB_G0267196 [Dictyostelium discoideum AX4]|uniref:Uncharacterized protein n=1 Tax=Dictyostelium discoideum TaxID=44689 RepID=Q55H67_DICDI|nr:hypothetical protein DDB_G0267196 [Dictyostelium discoideum AX4]EAL73835.1 hypothetical protein DDB_G0267196 [Dictyostelium discoideum AX4]|eukprot:XP_647759.1 hypothetical protein DDB_G0267196 [Dictyostelium discoideum AX4]
MPQQRLKEVTQQIKHAQAKQIDVTKGIQERSQQIKQLQAQIDGINKQYQPSSQTRPLEEVEREQQALEAKLQQLLNDFRKKKTQLEQAQNLAQKAQADLGQEIAQEKAKQDQLEATQRAKGTH